MKYHETDNYSFLLGNNHYVYDHKEDEDSLHLFVKSKPHSCKCPECGQESRKLHATYKRDLQDTPIHCKQTYLHARISMRKPFLCLQSVYGNSSVCEILSGPYRCVKFPDSRRVNVPQQ